jgi:hypothetical protein
MTKRDIVTLLVEGGHISVRTNGNRLVDSDGFESTMTQAVLDSLLSILKSLPATGASDKELHRYVLKEEN